MSNPANQTFALALLNALGIPPNSSSVQRIMATIGASGSLIPVQSPVIYDPSSGALTLSSVPQTSIQGLPEDLDAKVDASNASAALVTPANGSVPREIRHIAGDVINVRNYGTVGDGVEDDTAAIQDAIDACPDGGALWIPAGRYKITSTLTVNNHIRIYGDFVGTSYTNPFGDGIWAGGSVQGTVLESHLTSGSVIHVLNDPRFLATSIENISFLSVMDETANSTALRIDFSIRGHYKNIWICNFKNGIYNNGSENIFFCNIFIVGCDTGCVWDNTANANILTNFNISGCHTGMTITGSTDNMISGSSIQGCTLNGIVVRTNSTCNIFQNIYFENLNM